MWSRAGTALLFLVLVAPGTQAQSGQAPFEIFAARMDPQFILPETGMGVSNVTVRVRCAPEDVPGTRITVTLDVPQRPAFASAVLTPPSATFESQPDRCATPDFEYVVSSDLVVTVTRNAPAFEPFVLTAKATLRRDTPGAPPKQYEPRTANVTAAADYLAQVRLSPSTTFVKLPPGRGTTFPVLVENLANGASNASVELATAPPGLNVTLPSAVQLGTKVDPSSGEPAKLLHLVVSTPPSDGYVNEVRNFVVEFSLRSVDPRGASTDRQTVTFSIQVQGFGSQEAGAHAGALGLVALVFVGILRRERP